MRRAVWSERRPRGLLISIFGELHGSPEPVLRGAASYVLEKCMSITRADLAQIVCKALGQEEQAVVSKAAEESIARGMLEGQLEEAAKMLLLQLEQRFGQIPEEWHRRIESASLAPLEDWNGRILEAESIEQVFGDS